MLPYIGLQMMERGTDAWGCTNGTDIIKHLGPIKDTWAMTEPEIDTWDQGIFHTRAASHGTGKLVENAHPFAFAKDENTPMVVGIHNGCLNNHEELNRKHNRDFQVDSMHLWAHRAEGKDWAELAGWGNVVWYETWPNGVRCISLMRFNSDNLVVCKLEQGELIFASTYSAIAPIARMVGNPVDKTYVLDEMRRYFFGQDENGDPAIYQTDDRYQIPRTMVQVNNPVYRNGQYVGTGTQRTQSDFGYLYTGATNASDEFCFKCGTVRINSKDQFLCPACFGYIVRSFKIERERKNDPTKGTQCQVIPLEGANPVEGDTEELDDEMWGNYCG